MDRMDRKKSDTPNYFINSMMMYLPKSRGGKNVFLIFKLSTIMDLTRRVFAIQYVIMYA